MPAAKVSGWTLGCQCGQAEGVELSPCGSGRSATEGVRFPKANPASGALLPGFTSFMIFMIRHEILQVIVDQVFFLTTATKKLCHLLENAPLASY